MNKKYIISTISTPVAVSIIALFPFLHWSLTKFTKIYSPLFTIPLICLGIIYSNVFEPSWTLLSFVCKAFSLLFFLRFLDICFIVDRPRARTWTFQQYMQYFISCQVSTTPRPKITADSSVQIVRILLFRFAVVNALWYYFKHYHPLDFQPPVRTIYNIPFKVYLQNYLYCTICSIFSTRS